jgi:hypothetical protein
MEKNSRKCVNVKTKEEGYRKSHLTPGYVLETGLDQAKGDKERNPRMKRSSMTHHRKGSYSLS